MEELDNVEQWAKVNNLTLNRVKCAEMVIHDKRPDGDAEPSA